LLAHQVVVGELERERRSLRGAQVAAPKRRAQHVLWLILGLDHPGRNASEAELCRCSQPSAAIEDDARLGHLERGQDPALGDVGDKRRVLLRRHLGNDLGLVMEPELARRLQLRRLIAGGGRCFLAGATDLSAGRSPNRAASLLCSWCRH
jgi:hypothetical protein